MTDFSKIQTIDDLEFQTERLERRAAIQRERISGHVDFVVRQYEYITGLVNNTIAPIRNTFNEYRTTIRVASRIIRAFIPKKK